MPTGSANGTFGFHGTALGNTPPISTDAIWDYLHRPRIATNMFWAGIGVALDQLITVLTGLAT